MFKMLHATIYKCSRHSIRLQIMRQMIMLLCNNL